MSATIITGDCRAVLASMDADSLDACVTDPPYELGFMGKTWDKSGVAFDPETWRAVYRVLKPGAHLLAFGSTRTVHRIAVAIEDAGFEIRDQICWLYGSGFPKSLDVSKAIDKAAGAKREVVGQGPYSSRRPRPGNGVTMHMPEGDPITAPATDLARQWDGWGTALKPAYEPIIVARKPFKGTVAQNVTTYGTGAINVDGCRIGTEEVITNHSRGALSAKSKGIYGDSSAQVTHQTAGQSFGRWPANVCLDEDAAAALDAMSGSSKSTGGQASLGAFRNGDIYGNGRDEREKRDPGYGDTGGASRFFYNSKSSRRERNIGLDRTYTVKYNVGEGGDASLCAETVRLLQRVTSGTPEVKWLTAESGGSIMALCPQDSLFTTLTAIRQITTSPTSPSWMRSPISEFTADANSVTANGGSRVDPVASSNAPTLISTSARTVSPLNAELVASRVLSAISSEDAWQPLSNFHSTVKPVALMRWLVRLVTPPSGTVLDPFAGSGSTGIACDREGFDSVLIELSPEYAEIARRRIDGDAPLFAKEAV